MLYGYNLDARNFCSGFPTLFNSLETSDYQKYLKSSWNLNNVPRLPGSLLSSHNCNTSGILVPRLWIGMCFTSVYWVRFNYLPLPWNKLMVPLLVSCTSAFNYIIFMLSTLW